MGDADERVIQHAVREVSRVYNEDSSSSQRMASTIPVEDGLE